MVWQDFVIGGSSVIFSIALIPQIYYGFKKKKGFVTVATSLPTFIGLMVVSITFFTLSLYFSSITSFIIGTLWLILLIQRLKYEAA